MFGSPTTRTGRSARRAVSVLAAGLVLTLAACGSQLDPQEVARTGVGTVVAGDGTAAGGTTAGTAAGATSGTAGGLDTSGGTTSTGGGTTYSGGGTTSTGGGTTSTGGGTTSSGGSTTSTGGGTTSTGSGTAPSGTTSSAPAATTGQAGACDGFKNGPGITDSTITIGNSSDISGPVPGLFETAQDGTEAFVAYFNATVPDGICGRHLALKTYDSRTDASADQQAYTAACNDVFAMVGSQSAFDSGGAAAAQSCGLPDIRAGSVTQARTNCSTCFASQAVNNNAFENAVPDFAIKNYGDAAQHAGFLYINAGAASENAVKQVKAMTRRGMHFDVVQGIDVAEFNYGSYVQKLKDEGVQVVFWTGAYQMSVRLRQAMQQAGYTPKLYLRDPTDYNPDYVSSGGSAVNGTVVYLNFVPFEEARSNTEMSSYLAYLQQVKPGTAPQFFGVFAWSAAQLFVDLATKLGGGLTRASLVQALKGVDNWTANGMTAPQPVGSKGTGECWRFIQLNGSSWQPVGGTKYSCNGLSSTS